MGTHHAPQQLPSDKAQAFFRLNGHSPVPLLVQWMVSTACSLRCPHCSAAAAAPRHTSSELAECLFDQSAALQVPQLLLTGGEPLEHPQFPVFVAGMKQRGLCWSLNTAVFPSREARKAIERHPPCFVAVSVDGPREIHDQFRGQDGLFDSALRAIRWFRGCGVEQVAAGTTVTAVNFPHLEETFTEVITSGATSWGLHMLVSEGRAARSRRLRLGPSEARSLVRFVARRRSSFPVTMADEIGYCGEWEPLLRDSPFFCGAGRTHCVVLPEGDVVPCTTLDRSVSVGSLLNSSLETLWQKGFQDLRRWRPAGVCVGCKHATACSGGCWLERRHGHHCHRPAWEGKALPLTALCVGLAACANQGQTPVEPRTAPVVSVESLAPATAVSSAPNAAPVASAPPAEMRHFPLSFARPGNMSVVDWGLLQYAVDSPLRVCSPLAAETLQSTIAALGTDPLAKYLQGLAQPACPTALAARIQGIRTALSTSHVSLNLIALLWRDLQEWALLDSPAESRSAQDRALLRAELRNLERVGEQWRAVTLAKKLDAFLSPDVGLRHSMMSKAGPPPGVTMLYGLGMRRWGPADARTSLAQSYLDQHPLGESLRLSLTPAPGSLVTLSSRRGDRPLSPNEPFGPFDSLLVPSTGKPVALTVHLDRTELHLTLAPGTEYAYLDLARLAYSTIRGEIEKIGTESGSVPDTFMVPWARERVLQDNLGARSSIRWRLVGAWLF